MRRFNSSKVKALGNLAPITERQKRYLRKQRGIVQPFSAATGPAVSDKPKERDYLCPMKPGFVPRKPRGRSHVLMGAEARTQLAARAKLREAFFASL